MNLPVLPFLVNQSIHAGFPSPALDYAEKPLDLNEYLIAHRAATFIFQVRGESMRNAGIFDGDKVIVDRSRSPKNGHIVIAAVNHAFTIKYLRIQGTRIELHPDNPDCSPIIPKPEDEVVIWGVVTAVVRKYL
jgi:DNA polymerase V